MKFNVFAFTVAFAIGMLVVYTCTPFPEVVVRYPRPNDTHSLRYQKENGVCMEYEMQEVSCSADVKPIDVNEEKDTRLLQG